MVPYCNDLTGRLSHYSYFYLLNEGVKRKLLKLVGGDLVVHRYRLGRVSFFNVRHVLQPGYCYAYYDYVLTTTTTTLSSRLLARSANSNAEPNLHGRKMRSLHSQRCHLRRQRIGLLLQ